MGKPQVQQVRDFHYVQHEPGNGTRYVAMAQRVPESIPQYGGKWLVTFPDYPGTAWYFDEGCHVFPLYVAEKLGNGRMFRLTTESPDVHEMCKVIAALVPGAEHAADTDDTGYFPPSYLMHVIR